MACNCRNVFFSVNLWQETGADCFATIHSGGVRCRSVGMAVLHLFLFLFVVFFFFAQIWYILSCSTINITAERKLSGTGSCGKAILWQKNNPSLFLIAFMLLSTHDACSLRSQVLSTFDVQPGVGTDFPGGHKVELWDANVLVNLSALETEICLASDFMEEYLQHYPERHGATLGIRILQSRSPAYQSPKLEPWGSNWFSFIQMISHIIQTCPPDLCCATWDISAQDQFEKKRCTRDTVTGGFYYMYMFFRFVLQLAQEIGIYKPTKRLLCILNVSAGWFIASPSICGLKNEHWSGEKVQMNCLPGVKSLPKRKRLQMRQQHTTSWRMRHLLTSSQGRSDFRCNHIKLWNQSEKLCVTPWKAMNVSWAKPGEHPTKTRHKHLHTIALLVFFISGCVHKNVVSLVKNIAGDPKTRLRTITLPLLMLVFNSYSVNATCYGNGLSRPTLLVERESTLPVRCTLESLGGFHLHSNARQWNMKWSLSDTIPCFWNSVYESTGSFGSVQQCRGSEGRQLEERNCWSIVLFGMPIGLNHLWIKGRSCSNRDKGKKFQLTLFLVYLCTMPVRAGPIQLCTSGKNDISTHLSSSSTPWLCWHN